MKAWEKEVRAVEMGERIQTLLAEKGMTIKGLAELSGVPVNTLYAITKRSGAKSARNDTIQKIARALGTTAAHLLGQTPRESEAPASAPPAGGREEAPAPRKGAGGRAADAELLEYLEELRRNPQKRTFLSLTKNASRADVEAAVAIVDAFMKSRGLLPGDEI